MPDELDRHAAFPIDGFLEWKNDQNKIGEFSDRLEALRTPCPDLRADVIHDWNSERLDPAREPEIEIREVDDDQRVRTIRTGPGHQPPQRRVRSRNFPEGLGQAGDRHTPIVFENRTARGAEGGASHASDGDLRIDPVQLAHECAGVQIAGRLAAGDQESCTQDRADSSCPGV
jgi:hypothetical protein